MAMDTSIDTRKSLRDMKLVCDLEMQGSTTLRDLYLLVCLYLIFLVYSIICPQRLASEHFDKGGNKWLIRHQDDDESVQDSSPHILAIRSNA